MRTEFVNEAVSALRVAKGQQAFGDTFHSEGGTVVLGFPFLTYRVAGLVGVVSVVSLGTLCAALHAVWNWYIHCNVRLYVLGASGVGKTVLIKWLAYPESSADTLKHLPRTSGIATTRVPGFDFGRKVFRGEYVDHPGAQLDSQVGSIYRRRGVTRVASWLMRERRIWVIVVAPTFDYKPADHVREIVNRQFGELACPIGLLGSRMISPPNGIVLVLSKFDAVSRYAPGDSMAPAKIRQLESDVADLESVLEGTCHAAGVEYRRVIVSAFEGWGRHQLQDAIGGILERRQ